MKKIILTLLVIITAIVVNSQTFTLQDNFEDGNITGWSQANITYFGATTTTPINGTYSLQNTDTVTVTANYTHSISTPLIKLDINADTTIWKFYLKFDNGTPSPTNKFYVYLFTDGDYTNMAGGSNTVNGYAIGVDIGKTDDTIRLAKITTGTASSNSIVKTNIVWNTNLQNKNIGFKITRTKTGKWEVFLDTVSNTFSNLFSCGSGNDYSLTNAKYFGIAYYFTKTNIKKFWLDDLSIDGALLVDTIPPQLQSYEVTSPSSIKLTFNENIDSTSASDIGNFYVNNTIGNPSNAVRDAIDKKIITLTFSQTFAENQNYNLLISNLKDESNNIIADTNVNCVWQNLKVTNITFTNTKLINIYFNKAVDQTTAQTITNYHINGSANPTLAQVDIQDNKIVHLTFASDFKNDTTYNLHVANIKDTYNNTMTAQDFPFTFYIPKSYDVVINELMIDVSPVPVALPAAKYIELYNNSNYDIDLSGWNLKIGTNSDVALTSAIIIKHSYAIICSSASATSFAPYGTVIPILNESNLTSTTGKTILLKDANNNTIEQITYDPLTWYNDPDKDNGGWSLERIDPTNICNQQNNWQASKNYIGGTPGMINSVYSINPDNLPPSIEKTTVSSARDIIIDFTEIINPANASTLTNYVLNSTINPSSITIDASDNTIIHLKFANNFNYGTNTILIKNIDDFCNNVMNDSTANFIYQKVYTKEVEPKSSNQLVVYFSESVALSQSQDINNYIVNSNIGKPIVAMRDANDSSMVHLLFQSNFTENQEYKITISGVTDIYGTSINTDSQAFVYHVPQLNDIVFNELMLDFNPAPYGLPATQYIEIYNTTNYDIWLTGWKFQADGESARTFPTVKIITHGFAILCSSNFETHFTPFGTTIQILGSSDLNQTGKKIDLYDANSNSIYTLTYSNTWYNDASKENGGWSLEKIDPTVYCESSLNWKASNDILGGTPGKTNSVYKSNPDTTKPKFISLDLVNSKRIHLSFSKAISSETALNLTNYAVIGVGNPYNISFDDTSSAGIVLFFQNQFTDNTNYTLQISNLTDNCGNTIEPTQKTFIHYPIHPEYIWVLNNKQLQIKFSEEVEYTSAVNTSNYIVNNGIGLPTTIIKSAADPSSVFLQFVNEFQDATVYTIFLSNITDVNNNQINDTSLLFTFYLAKPNDVVINEVLYNPLPNCVDFVELYNRSIYPINLKDLRIGTINDTGAISTYYNIVTNSTYLQPSTYVCLSTDTNNVKATYLTHGNNFIELPNMPSYADDKGDVLIFDVRDSIIDEFKYTSSMQFQLLSDENGVSLERIDYNSPTQDSKNWHSAAATVDFATPGTQNSQYRNLSDTAEIGSFKLEPEVFSPDNDGYNDQLNIYYNFKQSGYVATLLIMDKNGHIVKNITDNELMGTNGFWVWDGLNNNNTKCDIGIYAVVIKVFDLNGKYKLYRLSVVINSKK